MMTSAKKSACATIVSQNQEQATRKRIVGGAWMAIALVSVFITMNQVLMVTLFSAY